VSPSILNLSLACDNVLLRPALGSFDAESAEVGIAAADVTNSMGLEWILIAVVPGKVGIHFHEWINLVGVLAALIEYWLVVGLNTGLGTGLIGIPFVTYCTTTTVLVTTTTVLVASVGSGAASPRAFCPEKLTPAAVLKMISELNT